MLPPILPPGADPPDPRNAKGPGTTPSLRVAGGYHPAAYSMNTDNPITRGYYSAEHTTSPHHRKNIR
jgi:hypothetical protein